MKRYTYRPKSEPVLKEGVNSHEMTCRHEKIPAVIYANANEAVAGIARDIAEVIRDKALRSEPFVFGLVTGSATLPLYEELVRLHKEEEFSFKNVHTFNIDEYYPIAPDALQSHYRYMKECLFDHVDIPEVIIHSNHFGS